MRYRIVGCVGNLALTSDSISMSGLWGPQTALDLYLQEEGITTLLFSGVNADQVRRFSLHIEPYLLRIFIVRIGDTNRLILQGIRLYPRE